MRLNKIAPREAGVSAKSLVRFFNALDALPFDMHSVILLRGHNVLLETYYEPFSADRLHRMYSITKSLTGLATGCLADEGKIDLDAPITEYFPEYPTEYEYIKKMTIRDMLMMRTAHNKTTYKADLSENWVESFFTTKPSREPGVDFCYDTSSSHTLAALVEKLTGMELLEYLRVKFLDKIGFSKEAYCLKDPFGVSIGGSGLMAKAMDVAKVARFIMDGGEYEGEQLISRDFVKSAVSNLTSTEIRGRGADERQGYGMHIWRTRHNGFMLYGLGGQLAVCLPDKDLIFATTADANGVTGGVQMIRDAFWNEIYAKLDIPEGGGEAELEEILADRKTKRGLSEEGITE